MVPISSAGRFDADAMPWAVRVSGSGYRSYRAAHDAGKKAMDKLLDDLARENRNKPVIK
jgi:hypothetical protein